MLKPFDNRFTKEAFDLCDCSGIIAKSDRKECHSYSGQFFIAAGGAEHSGDGTSFQMLVLMGCLTSLLLRSDKPAEPYGPCFVHHDGRSAVVEDLDDTHLGFLAAIVTDIPDDEMRARVADILWIRTRDYRFGEAAVRAYIGSAKALEDFANWIHTAYRLERALHIGASLGKNGRCCAEVVGQIEMVLDACNGEDPLYMSHKLMEMLLDHGHGDTAKYAPLAQKLALRAEGRNDWEKARQHWETVARWHAKAGDKEQERLTRITAAETHVKHAEWCLACEQPQHLLAAHWRQCAYEAMRRIPGTAERATQLHVLLLACQEKTPSELKPFSQVVDVSDIAAAAGAHVKGKSLSDALLALATIGCPPKVSLLRDQAIEHRKQFILMSVFPRTFLNAAGRTIARQPDNEEERLQADMWYNASAAHAIHVQGLVEPARQQILLEHDVRLPDFAPFVTDSPFVRPGREMIVGRGLYEGIRGDILTSTHLLIPQIEDSVRYILYHKGVITSGLDDDGIQDDFNLNKMLTFQAYKDPLTEVLGEDLVFDLRGLLIERYGANLRNDTAHGLISHNAFYSYSARYLWWLALRFYAWPTAVNLKEPVSTQNVDEAEEEGHGIL